MGQAITSTAFSSVISESSKSTSGSSEKIPKCLANFWWDRCVFLLIVLNVSIIAVEAALSIFDSDLQIRCYIQEEHTSEQAVYVNSLCLSDAPEFSKYVRLITFSQVAILSALQYFWHLVSGSGKTENFLILLAQMKFVREPETGKFCANDLEIARRLQYRFGKRRKRKCALCCCNTKHSVYCSYVFLKLILQLLICVVFIILYIFSNQSKMGQKHTFICQNDTDVLSNMYNQFGMDESIVAEWPLSVFAVSCTFVPLVSLTQLQYFNIAILILICGCLLVGLILITIVPFGSKKILFEDIAKFVAYTGLRADHFHKDLFHYWNSPSICKQAFYKRTKLIWKKSDLQFLLLRLYATDYRAGSILRDILIEKEVNRIREDTCCCKGEHKELNKQQHTDEHLTIKNSISDCVKSIWNQEVDANGRVCSGGLPYCILVTHETDLFTYILDHHQFKKMMCINFNPYVLPTDDTPKISAKSFDLHSGAPTLMQIPSHKWSWNRTKEEYSKLKSAIQDTVSRMVGSNSSGSECGGQCEVGQQEERDTPDQQSLVSPSSNGVDTPDDALSKDVNDANDHERLISEVPPGAINNSGRRRKSNPPRITDDHGLDEVDESINYSGKSRSHSVTDGSNEWAFSQQSSTTSSLVESDLLIIFTPLSDKEFGALHIDHRVSELLKCLSPGQHTYALIYYPTKIGGRQVEEDEFRGKPYGSSKIPSCLHRLRGLQAQSQTKAKCFWEPVDGDDIKTTVEGVFAGVQCKFDVNLYKYIGN